MSGRQTLLWTTIKNEVIWLVAYFQSQQMSIFSRRDIVLVPRMERGPKERDRKIAHITKFVFTSYLDSFYFGFHNYVASRLQLARVSSIFNSIIQTSESQLAFEGLIDGSHNAVCHLALEGEILKNYENHREINNSLVGHKFN